MACCVADPRVVDVTAYVGGESVVAPWPWIEPITNADPSRDSPLGSARTESCGPTPSINTIAAIPRRRGERIEQPAHGFTVTFPDDWTVEPVTDQTHQILLSVLEPSDRTRQRTLLAAGSSDGYCVVVDSSPLAQEAPERTSIYAATGSFLAGLAADPDIIGPQSIIEDLPAEPTGHITATDLDGWTLGQYHFTDGDTWVYLDCRSPIPPGDGWISIAESFEFLPTEE